MFIFYYYKDTNNPDNKKFFLWIFKDKNLSTPWGMHITQNSNMPFYKQAPSILLKLSAAAQTNFLNKSIE